VRQAQASEGVSMEAEVPTKLEAVIRQQVKMQQPEDLVHTVVTRCKCPVNLITNPNPVSSHSNASKYVYMISLAGVGM
jgi:ATP-dependent phosphoenolpyruvate carboxykinase